MRVAALTMAYNEPVWAKVWARHYAGQLGAEHCTILDPPLSRCSLLDEAIYR